MIFNGLMQLSCHNIIQVTFVLFGLFADRENQSMLIT